MENQYQPAMLMLLGIMQHLRLLQNCPALILHGPITILRINVPTGDASQTNSSDEVNQRQPILKKTPPIIGEESSSADEKGLVSPLLKGNGVTKVYEALSIAPRNDEDEKKANVKETKPPAKRTYSRTAQKSKQQSTRPKYKEVSTDADDDSEDEVETERMTSRKSFFDLFWYQSASFIL